jgi:diadenosine tetraphosphatase ApaH/serine/threonine PP2A family protein phosphatase
MRVAVVSDIHGNLPALEAVLKALAPYDALWQLGDIVGYGPQPDEVVGRLRAESARGVCGNHDAAALGRIESSWFNEDARSAVHWTAETIGQQTREWLGELPQRTVQHVKGEETHEGTFTLVHGSPRDPIWEYVFSGPVAEASFRSFATAHCLVGHTHVPLVFREDDGAVEALSPSPKSQLKLDARRTILNPGSVGQPRDGDPRACGMILDTDAMTAEWHRVDYPITTTQERMRSAGLPRRLVERLSRGL